MNPPLIPPIKSQGKKTAVLDRIAPLVPQSARGRFIEPFMGTGVVGLNLAAGPAVLSDTNPHLVRFYDAIRSGSVTPDGVRRFLEREGALLLERGEDHFYAIRDRFNRRRAPLDFLFLSRAAFNGMIRFNRAGGFNVPFCRKPARFSKTYVTKIVNQVERTAERICGGRFVFLERDFRDAIADAGRHDFLYCDPPYLGRHADYHGAWDEAAEEDLYRGLDRFRGRFVLSTWWGNRHRRNRSLLRWEGRFRIITFDHFYHVGAKLENRGEIVEALVTNVPDVPVTSSARGRDSRAPASSARTPRTQRGDRE